MADNPRISVIIPSLNQCRYLERAICSVLDQNYDNLELIVIDGDSQDDSVRTIERYDNAIAYWHSEMDSGPADAINSGLARATGDIIGILHADDLYLPGALDAAADAMSRRGKAQWIVSHVLRIDADDQHLGQLSASAPDAAHWHLFLSQEQGVLPLSASFYQRRLFDRFGGFDATLHYAYDFDFHARLLHKGYQPQVLELVLAAQREHGDSRCARAVVAMGAEQVDTALKHGEHVEMRHRFALWQSCDEKRRIYAIAAAEMGRSDHRRFLWQKLLRHPWWLASARYRESLLRGVLEPIQLPQRKAA